MIAPMCPLCDDPILIFEPHSIAVEDDCKFLVHTECVEGEDDGEIDETD